MDCLELRERYADIRDGLITAPRERRRFQRHLAQCATCREWEAALQRGVRALQATLIEPSPEFRSRLEARLVLERQRLAEPKIGVRAGLAAPRWSSPQVASSPSPPAAEPASALSSPVTRG